MNRRTTSGLSRPVLRWVSQVTASLGATLAATLIWSAVPHPAAPPAPQPELTSGGKFAARAVGPAAYDGLDTMPLPHLAPAAASFVVAADAAPAAALHRAVWDGASPLVLAPERPTRAPRSARPPVRAEARRIAEPAPRAAPIAAAEPAPEAKDDEGFLPRLMPKVLPRVLPAIASTARDAWTVTASAGGSLISHVVPQIP